MMKRGNNRKDLRIKRYNSRELEFERLLKGVELCYVIFNLKLEMRMPTIIVNEIFTVGA